MPHMLENTAVLSRVFIHHYLSGPEVLLDIMMSGVYATQIHPDFDIILSNLQH